MKLKHLAPILLLAAGPSVIQAEPAAETLGVLACEFKAIVPENAVFFTSHFRPFPVVGTKVLIDFDAPAITSMTFTDGQVFFAEGDATLTRLRRFGQNSGFGGIRQGNLGFYIGYLAPAWESPDEPGLYTSRFALTNAWRGENFHLETQETHYGDLECRRPANGEQSK
jgi:hypothetical protein